MHHLVLNRAQQFWFRSVWSSAPGVDLPSWRSSIVA